MHGEGCSLFSAGSANLKPMILNKKSTTSLSDETPIDGSGGNDGIEPVSILEEMQRSYLDYAMSVIVSRALAGCPRRTEAGPPPHPLCDA